MNLSTGDANEEGRERRQLPQPQPQPKAQAQAQQQLQPASDPATSSGAEGGATGGVGAERESRAGVEPPFVPVPLSTSSTPLLVPLHSAVAVDIDPASERLEHKFARRRKADAQGFAQFRNPLLASDSTTATGGGVSAEGLKASSVLKTKVETSSGAVSAAAAAAAGIDLAAQQEADPAEEGVTSSERERRRRRRRSKEAGDVPAAGATVTARSPGKAQAAAPSEAMRIRPQPAAEAPAPSRQLAEVDFYRNPTLLSRLLLNQKYKVAMGRLKRHPEEARIVVVATRTAPIHPSSPLSSATPYSMRQLPIHLACLNLGRTIDPALKDILNQLITHLVVTFPEGCQMSDHVNVLPIQYAVRHGAQASTVSLLLMAAPESLTCRDGHGRNLLQLNRACDSPYRKQVSQVLKLDVEFWKQSRQEANVRLQQQQQQQHQPQLEVPHPSQQPTSERLEGNDPAPNPSADDATIEPMAWEQLETRAIALEQILNEMNEKNYTLHRRIEHLVDTKMDLLDHLDTLKQSTLAHETRRLQQQNLALHRQLSDLRDRLRRTSSVRVGQPAPEGAGAAGVQDEEKHEIGATPDLPRQPRTESESSSLVGHSPFTPSTHDVGSTPQVRQRRSESQSSSLVGHSPLTPPSPGSAAESVSTRTSTRALQTRSLQADNLKLIQANHHLRTKYERLNREYKAQQAQLNKLVQLIRRLSKDTATVLLAGVASGQGIGVGADDDLLEGDDRASRHTQKSHVSTLSGSPLTRSEDSSISESAQLRERADAPPSSKRRGQPPSERRRQHPQAEDSSAIPRRQRTIEIQWHSASTGLGLSASSFRERRGRRRPPRAEAEEEKMEEAEDMEHELSDSLSVLFARAIDHEASLPYVPSPIAPSSPLPLPLPLPVPSQGYPGAASPSSPRRRVVQRPSAGSPSAEAEDVFTTPPSSPGRAAPSALDDLQIPALLDVAGSGRPSTPPMSL